MELVGRPFQYVQVWVISTAGSDFVVFTGRIVMDFICPNCQKMITVPDQYAGQHMRCPLCEQTFQAPALPGSAPIASAPLPPTEAYQLSPEPQPAAPPPSAIPPASARVEAPMPKASVSAPPPPPPPPPPPAGYGRKFSLQLNPVVLAWIPAASLFLIFILTFFTWVGSFPGGVGVYTQSAWQVFWGGSSIDPVYKKDVFEDQFRNPFDEKQDMPSFSFLTFCYLFTLVPVMVAVIAITVASQLKLKLPPVVEKVWEWRYLAVGVLTAVPLFFLLLQSLAGFPLEDKLKSLAIKPHASARSNAKTDDEIKKVDILEGKEIGALCLHRTWARSFAVLLQLLATACAFLAYWMDRRGPSRPAPRLEFLW
jgi:hypothetical protein